MKPRSNRLNSNNRDKFIHRVMEDKLPDSNYPQDDRFFNKWNSRIYQEAYGPYVEAMAKLPDWFFIRSSIITVKLSKEPDDSTYHAVKFNLPDEELHINEASGYRYSDPDPVFPKLPFEHEACSDWRALKQAQNDFRTQQRELRNQLHTLAYSCNTSGQLYKAWDEAINYSDCFPYVAPERHSGAAVSQRELDIGIKIAGTTVNLPDDLSNKD